MTEQLSSSKTFKIRKTQRVQRTQEAQEQEEVSNLKDLRISETDNQPANQQESIAWGILTLTPNENIECKKYQNDEQEVNCNRFPHSSFCGCESNCLIQNFDAVEVALGLYYGGFVSGLKVRSLLELGITHILNVTSKQYTKRTKYFEYLNIDLHNNTEEDAKKFFRLTNRFIKSAITKRGKVFIHASDLQLAAVVAMGYLIGVLRVPMKQSLQIAVVGKTEIAPHFIKQLESYDLQKMAFVSLQRQ